MFPVRRLIGSSLFVFVLFSSALAQEKRAPIEKPPEPVAAGSLVTATATVERVRITAPASVARMHVEVYATSGEKLFDNEIRGGNIFDWHLQDGQAQRLTAGDYVCVVTVKNISGKITQRIGTVTVGENSVSVGAADSKKLLTPQVQAIGPVEENASWTILAEQENQTTTVIAHDGTDGQIVRGRGALSFRLGDFFSGKDSEQMRLTEEGNLGIGTAKPQAKLDVAGTIRAREGFMFADGSTLKLNEKGVLTRTNADGAAPSSLSSTQNRIVKFTDNAGTVGDSIAIDTGTGLQLTAAASASVDTNILYLDSTSKTTGVIGGSQAAFTATSGPFFAMRGNTYTAIGGGSQRGLFAIAAGDIPGATGRQGSILFNTGPDQVRMSIKPSGDVGIGTETPAARLDVAGNINTSTQYNIGGSRVLSNAGPENLFVGNGAGFSNTAGFNNSFVGSNAGFLNTMGINNSFVGVRAGQSNTVGGDNSFFGRGAGTLNQAGDNNSFFGYFAGLGNTMGNSNSFVGVRAGQSNTTGSSNTIIGEFADVGLNNLTNATAIGARSFLTQDNSLVLGSINGINGAAADTNVGIGTTAPARRLHIKGAGSDGAGQTDLRITGTGQIASGITLESTGTGGRTYSWLSTADNTGGGGSGPGRLAAFDVTANAYRMVIDGSGNVGIGTFTPLAKLDVNGAIRFNTVPAGTGAALCWDSTTALIVNCSASSARYKQNIFGLRLGLDVVRRLHPVSFTWKEDGQRDLGLVAEAVNRVEPLLVTHNARGEVEGVRYDRLGVVLVNAVKEQQLQLEAQQKQIKEQNELIKKQQTEVEVLRVLVCSQNVNADICKPKN